MHIDRSLLTDARRVAGEVKEFFNSPHQELIRNGVDHIVRVLEQPSKTKLRSAVAKARDLCRDMEANANLQCSVGWIGDRIERKLPPPKGPKRRR